jgi:secreted PhoX family phosphatase
MKKLLLSLLLCSMVAAVASAQKLFSEELLMPANYTPTEVLLPPSPLKTQVLFVGGHDIVQTTPTYRNPSGRAIAKEWHDFIGFTPDNSGTSLGWISVNHEMIYHDDKIGDGGGMTAFRVKRNADDQLEVVEQTLADGRKGQFFNVDFANTVGETGMNCGGISTLDGRIWTAEEWWISSNAAINTGNTITAPTNFGPFRVGTGVGMGVRDTALYTIKSDLPGIFNGKKIKKYQNFNWLVEIDPKQAKAIRKQYNWGRQPFEGGAISKDNKTVYFGPDATPGYWGKFEAEVAGDFSKGKLYVYKHDLKGYKWLEINQQDSASMFNHHAAADKLGATMYARIEWVAIDYKTGIVYWTETGNDSAGRDFGTGAARGGVADPYHIARATKQGRTTPNATGYTDYYGRVWAYDPKKDTNYVFIEGGPELATSASQAAADYPKKHLSNPDGLNVMTIDGKSFLVICEDLNGTTYNRTPAGVSNATCELFLLDLSIAKPTVDNLIRLTAVPRGAEVTGVIPTPDGKSLLVNAQHSDVSNPFPYNHSFTFAIHGFDKLKVTALQEPTIEKIGFKVYPNPTTRMVYFNKTTDIAIYNVEGKRMRVERNTNQVDVSDLVTGIYFVQTAEGDVAKLMVQE